MEDVDAGTRSRTSRRHVPLDFADALDDIAAPGEIDLGILSGFAQQVTAEQDLAVKIGKGFPPP